MFCRNCGKELNENAKFCTECGMKINSSDSSVSDNNSISGNNSSKKVLSMKVKIGILAASIILIILTIVIIVALSSSNDSIILENPQMLKQQFEDIGYEDIEINRTDFDKENLLEELGCKKHIDKVDWIVWIKDNRGDAFIHCTSEEDAELLEEKIGNILYRYEDTVLKRSGACIFFGDDELLKMEFLSDLFD